MPCRKLSDKKMGRFADRLESLRRTGTYRSVENAVVCGAKICKNGRKYADFSSNDYLGLSSRVDLQRKFFAEQAGSNRFLMGSLSSRLLGCNSFAHADFEDFMGGVYSGACGVRRACLLFNCGYHANSGIIPALAASGDLVVADRLSHASLIDALRLTDAKWMRFPHNDIDRLDEILEKRRGEFKDIYIVTESVFSMDGDFCDIERLVALKKKYGAFLYIDEAHSFGVFGERGLGRCADSGLLGEIDAVMCTLGKAAASEGAFAICSEETREMIVNKCRTFIFSTALSPIAAMWSKFICGKIFSMGEQRRHLMEISEIFRRAVRGAAGGDSQIVPARVAGGAAAAAAVSGAMAEAGFFVPAIRHPTVPKGTERLRFSFTAAHSAEDALAAASAFNAFAGGGRLA